MMDGDDYGAVSEMNNWQGEPKYSEETCPSALTPARTRGRCGGKPATYRRSYGTAVYPSAAATHISGATSFAAPGSYIFRHS
jgi:hypothetical protein